MSSNFALDISKFCKKANANIDVVVRKITFDVFSRVVQKTPVDTGRAKGNWLPSVNSPSTVTVDVRSAAEALSEIGKITLSTPAGGSVYLVNNLPYIQRLENGWSTQAHNGMVGLTLAELPYIVEVKAKEVRG